MKNCLFRMEEKGSLRSLRYIQLYNVFVLVQKISFQKLLNNYVFFPWHSKFSSFFLYDKEKFQIKCYNIPNNYIALNYDKKKLIIHNRTVCVLLIYNVQCGEDQCKGSSAPARRLSEWHGQWSVSPTKDKMPTRHQLFVPHFHFLTQSLVSNFHFLCILIKRLL